MVLKKLGIEEMYVNSKGNDFKGENTIIGYADWSGFYVDESKGREVGEIVYYNEKNEWIGTVEEDFEGVCYWSWSKEFEEYMKEAGY